MGFLFGLGFFLVVAGFFRVGARGHVSGASAQSWGPGARGRELSAGCVGLRSWGAELWSPASLRIAETFEA